MEKFFKFKENNTNVKTELTAGFTTFMTMAYILAVNPSMLKDAGMDATAVLLATCFASFLATFIMGMFANLPFALSAGMGLNAYFTYTVVISYGYSWQTALMAIFIEGLIFIILSITNVREAIFDAIPFNLKKAVSVGIGVFITFIGLQNSGLCVKNDSTLVGFIHFGEAFNTKGICALLAIVGLFIITFLYLKKVKGAMFIGIIITWVLGMICQLTGIYKVDAENGFYSLFPVIQMTDFSALGNTFLKCFECDFSNIKIFDFIMVVFAFLFVDMFDTIGTLIGVSNKAGMLDKEGKLRGVKPALMADAIGTTSGALLGTSTVSTFVESAAGVAEGGRTGLTAVTTGILFLISTLFAPVFTAIPSFATAPALMFVGFLMFGEVKDIDFHEDKLIDAVPAFLCIISMPLFYSIAEGIAVGIISYVLLHLFAGKGKQVKPLMYVLVVLFILKYVFL